MPAVDVLRSTSRLMNQVATKEHLDSARKAIAILAAYSRAEDLIRIGAYQKGSDPEVDRARQLVPLFEQYITQELNEYTPFEEALKGLNSLIKQRREKK